MRRAIRRDIFEDGAGGAAYLNGEPGSSSAGANLPPTIRPTRTATLQTGAIRGARTQCQVIDAPTSEAARTVRLSRSRGYPKIRLRRNIHAGTRNALMPAVARADDRSPSFRRRTRNPTAIAGATKSRAVSRM